jgi:hypothetical protein
VAYVVHILSVQRLLHLVHVREIHLEERKGDDLLIDRLA